jgi:GT2 family glycosyltransferase
MINFPKVFIIVLHYQNWDDTNECLDSLKKIDYDNFEIMVIDNDKENQGFAKGNNIGIKQALEKKADYILLLNNDTIVDPDFLKKLVEAGESGKQFGILGPVIYKYPTNEIHFDGGKINRLYTKGMHQTGATDYITGACMLIKREVIEKIGLMDEDYFLYFEDVDWCLRARRAGYKCVVVPTSKIWHKVSSSAKENSFSYIYYHTRNGFLMAKKNAPFPIKILAYLNSFLIYIKQVIKLIIFPSKKIWAQAIKRGINDFYRRKVGKLES